MNSTFTTRHAWRLAAPAALFVACASTGAAPAPGATQQSANVEVGYRDPARLSDTERGSNDRTDWLDELSAYVLKHASQRVPAGQRLSVTIDDVRLAGMFERWRPGGLSDVRIVRDVTPPRIDLTFRLVSAQGEVLKQGERRLRDINFLGRSYRHRDEALSYEKGLVDDWLAAEFGVSRP